MPPEQSGSCGRAGFMAHSAEDKLLSLLTEIHSDLGQIKSDLQSLLTLLKQQQQKPTPVSFFQ
jgi:hypothetical protein